METNSTQAQAAQISQLSLLRAAQGDGRLSAETLAAVQEGAVLPPTVSEQTDANNAASEAAPATDPSQSLAQRVDIARETARLPQDIVQLSPEATAQLNAEPVDVVTGQPAVTDAVTATEARADTPEVAPQNTPQAQATTQANPPQTQNREDSVAFGATEIDLQT